MTINMLRVVVPCLMLPLVYVAWSYVASLQAQLKDQKDILIKKEIQRQQERLGRTAAEKVIEPNKIDFFMSRLQFFKHNDVVHIK